MSAPKTDLLAPVYLLAFCFLYLTSVQNLDMKTSTSSVVSTSDVSTKDRSSLTDRLTSITDEGMESLWSDCFLYLCEQLWLKIFASQKLIQAAVTECRVVVPFHESKIAMKGCERVCVCVYM